MGASQIRLHFPKIKLHDTGSSERRARARGFLPRKSGGSGSPRFRAGVRLRSRLAAGGASAAKMSNCSFFLLTAHFPRALILRIFQPTEFYELDLSISRGRLRDRMGGRPQIFARVYEACPVGGDDLIHAFQRRAAGSRGARFAAGHVVCDLDGHRRGFCFSASPPTPCRFSFCR